jgi:nucleoside-diphosphate-sugar epimerase
MAGELILLTGATGFIGFATLRLALKHGYKIRAAVRSEKKAETVRSNPTLKDISEDQLSFVVVPDFIAEGAFDEAAKDVDYILHIASPIPSDNLSGDSDLYAALIQPAEKATLGIFKSAQKSKTTKRVVVTSSAAAIVPISAFTGTDEIYTPDHRTEPLPPPYFNNVQAAYGTAKCLALKSAEDFMANEKPAFDAIHIHPSVVLGRDERALTTETLKDDSSNAIVLKLVLGQNHDGFPISVAHIEDVAEAHVRALGPKVKGNQSFLVSSKGDEGNTVSIPSLSII